MSGVLRGGWGFELATPNRLPHWFCLRICNVKIDVESIFVKLRNVSEMARLLSPPFSPFPFPLNGVVMKLFNRSLLLLAAVALFVF